MGNNKSGDKKIHLPDLEVSFNHLEKVLNKQGYKIDPSKEYAEGGVVKTKKGITNDGKDGGYFDGRSHAEGGIEAVNVDTQTPIEVEGGEVVITKKAVGDQTKRDFMGKKMTNREILSYINQSGGGVALEKGGHIMEDGGEVDENIVYENDKNIDDWFIESFEKLGEYEDVNAFENNDNKNFITNSLNLLKVAYTRKRLELNLLSKSANQQTYNKTAKELSDLSSKIAQFELVKDFEPYKWYNTIFNSLNERGNAINLNKSNTKEYSDFKKVDPTFEKAVYSKQFKDWFGDWELAKETGNYSGVSRAVNEEGFPQVYFHGGRQYQTTYRPIDQVSVFYWAEDFEYAKWFGENAYSTKDTDSVLLKAYVSCKNPIDLTPFGYRPVDLGDLIRFITIFYPQTNIIKFLPKKYIEKIQNKEQFNIKVRAWQIIRQFNDWVKAIRDEGVFDGFMYEENNPSHIINGEEHHTKAFAIFFSNQIKFAHQFAFNPMIDDFRFDVGGLVI